MPYPLEELYADVAQVWHSAHGLFGSGRLIGRSLILTARHVVTPEGVTEPVKEGWQVRLFAGRTNPPEAEKCTWIEGSVAWAGQDELDLALLELHPQATTPDWSPKLKLRIGRIDQVQHHSVRGLGFPRGAKVDDRRMLFVPSGTLDDENGNTLCFGIDQQYQPESPNEDWRGFSGGAVLLAESRDPEVVWVYGVAQQVPECFTRRLDVARLATAWKDPDFQNVLKAASVSLEPPEDPVISAQLPQPELTRAEPESPNLFYYASRRIEFRGRQSEMQLLDGFLAYPAQFAWYLITGAGGVGKSRLALEFCLRNQDNWQAGFVNKWLITDIEFWRTWRPNRPTLLVFDDAAAYGKELGELARFLRTKTHVPFHVRLLLVERDKKDWLDKFMGKGMSDREEILLSQYPARGAPPLEVGQLADADTLQIMQSTVGSPESTGIRADTMLSRLRRLDSMARPLFAAFLAATYSRKIEDPTGVMREILHDEQTRWEAAGITDEDKRLVALATICGGITNRARMGSPPSLDNFKQGFSASRYQAIVGKPATAVLAALEPDILGELFVLDWLGDLEDVEVASVLDTAWSLSAGGFQAFIFRAVPDFPEHQALRTLLKTPEVSPSVRNAWSSAIVTLLRDMPTRHLDLGVELYDELKAVALRHRDEPLLYEDLVRAATNLMLDFQSSGQRGPEQRQYAEVKELVDNHPDKEQGAEGRGRLLVYSIQVYTRENEAELARPLPAAPLTFLHPISRLKIANHQYEELTGLCELHAENVELRRTQAAAAFDLILGYSAIARASTRVQVPAIFLLRDQIKEQVTRCEEIYKGLDSLLSKYPRVAELDLFLAKSASAIVAAYSSVPGLPGAMEKSTSLYKQLCELTTAHPGAPELREELARAAYNLVLLSHNADRLSEAREFYEKLCDLAKEYPNEVALGEKKNRAAKLLEH